MTGRSPPRGPKRTIGVPNTPTRRASVNSAAPTPSSVDRHWRVTPTAMTIVTASTISTTDARNAETNVTRTTELMSASSPAEVRPARSPRPASFRLVERAAGGDRQRQTEDEHWYRATTPRDHPADLALPPTFGQRNARGPREPLLGPRHSERA